MKLSEKFLIEFDRPHNDIEHIRAHAAKVMLGPYAYFGGLFHRARYQNSGAAHRRLISIDIRLLQSESQPPTLSQVTVRPLLLEKGTCKDEY